MLQNSFDENLDHIQHKFAMCILTNYVKFDHHPSIAGIPVIVSGVGRTWGIYRARRVGLICVGRICIVGRVRWVALVG